MATVDVTSQRVQRILVGEFEVTLTKDGGFRVDLGSTAVFITVKEWTPDNDGNPRSIVRVSAPLGRKVAATPELFRWAAIDGRARLFGGVTVFEEEGGTLFLVYDHTLLGDFIDPAEMITAVYAIGSTADEFDEIVHDRFGGKRYTDPDTDPD